MSKAPDEADQNDVDQTVAGEATTENVVVRDDDLTGSGPAEATAGEASVGDASVGGSSGGSTGGSSGGGRTRSTSDSRRVAPKWLGKKIGRFRLQAMLGAGAVGRVFRAEDTILHRRVALKVIALHGSNGQINKGADQFITEAQAAAALEHPNVVQIYEAGESGNLCYIAMELLEGGSLKDLVDASGPMDPGRACLLTADAAEALAVGHAAGIVHRDIKPANLMLSRMGRCKVTDFGLATFVDSADSIPRDRAAGTPLFAAPEVIRGTSADERSDIYSLGATLYYLLTGRPPYKAKTRAEVLRMHVAEPIPNLRTIRPGLPESLVAAVERSLDKDPGQRFATATQFARVLRVQTIPVAPMPPTGPDASMNSLAGVSVTGSSSSPGASLMGLSGMTAVVGSSSGRLGGIGGGGRLSEADLGTVAQPVSATAPLGVEYRTRVPAAPIPRWRSPVALSAIGVAAVGLIVGLTLLATRQALPRMVAANPIPAAPPTVPPAAVTPAPPATLAPAVTPPTIDSPPATAAPTAVKRLVTPAVVYTPAELTPIPVTDLDHLQRIAEGKDPDHPNGVATVLATVVATRPSANKATVRIEFADTKFWIAYWVTNPKFAQAMADRYGVNSQELVGKTIRVTEKVKMYDGLPEFLLMAPAHLKVVPAN